MLTAERETASPEVLRLRMYIDGEWCEAESGDTFEVRSPVAGQLIATLPNASVQDVDRAVEAAKRAREKVRSIPVAERAKLMYKLVDAIMENRDQYARECTLEQGKAIKESYGEIDEVGPNILQQAEDMKRLTGEVHEPILKHNLKIFSVHEPYGVFGAITPWNFPWLLPVECVPQAIMAGNSVVFKPAETTPICGVRLVECMERVGFPKGSVNLVTGESGPIVGGRIVEHPDVNAICFTGETRTGEEIVRRAGVKKVILEMGGLGPLIVFKDADLTKAVEDAAFGCYYNAGQCCVANERILIHEDLHDRFVKLLVDRTKKVRLGNPFDPNTHMGPLNNEPVAQKIEQHLEDGVSRGAEILVGGQRAPGFPTRLYFPPTVVDQVTTEMLFNKEETFGPVAPVITFANIDEAIDIANGSPYGLSAAIQTNDLNTAFYVADRIKAGQVVINESATIWEYQYPWGGAKKSGLGRLGGMYTVREMTETKTILLSLSPPRLQ